MTTPQAPTRHAEVAGAGFAGLTVMWRNAMAETRNMAKGNHWTPRLLETANFVSAAVPPGVEELYPVPEASRSW